MTKSRLQFPFGDVRNSEKLVAVEVFQQGEEKQEGGRHLEDSVPLAQRVFQVEEETAATLVADKH
jgi:hypothetical protein